MLVGHVVVGFFFFYFFMSLNFFYNWFWGVQGIYNNPNYILYRFRNKKKRQEVEASEGKKNTSDTQKWVFVYIWVKNLFPNFNLTFIKNQNDIEIWNILLLTFYKITYVRTKFTTNTKKQVLTFFCFWIGICNDWNKRERCIKLSKNKCRVGRVLYKFRSRYYVNFW